MAATCSLSFRSRAVTERWTDREGVTWECSAYDHGPLCRSCRMVPRTPLYAACPTCDAHVDEPCRTLARRGHRRHPVSYYHAARPWA